ncbi:hypothetical protein [Chryseobacterium sp. ISL-6]|uniref:hypothetical protein n=1 Tax=Chryseobacterium sp. ISL-6 TaxID=2819143 RepID=UPI001BE6849C|nr:hypothetical protein [Chryseobacterium sp. ISL-6]MBT2622252.1 hypothetical protein [Chryseobacterium sp. ISL-6]
MEKETVDYIKNYFSNLMTNDEMLALQYHMYIQSTPEEFELEVAKRIMAETPEKVFFNNCPKCYKLARTPRAKQCRYCGHSWRDRVVAQFKLDYVFQITGRQFFLFGRIMKGEIKEGQLMDLTVLGLNKKPTIKSIEFAHRREEGKEWEDIGLGTDELTEEDKQYLKDRSSFENPFDVIVDNRKM